MLTLITALALAAYPFGPAEPVSDLPLKSFAAAVPSPTMAVMVTGTNGWASVDRSITQKFLDQGIPVVAFDMSRYLKTSHTPAQMGADLARVVRYYSDSWDADSVLLIGYAQGATALTFMSAQLPPDVRGQVHLVGLLEPGRQLGNLSSLTESQGLAGLRVVCVYGSKETNTLCPALPSSLGSVIVTDGGHHLDHNYVMLTDLLLERAAHPAAGVPGETSLSPPGGR